MSRLMAKGILSKKGNSYIKCLTSYTHNIATKVDSLCDIILVGDSLGTVLYGFEKTTSVTLDMMIMHGKSVCRAVQKSLVAVDMPFGTFESSKKDAFRNASQILHETGCEAVKIEGFYPKTVEFLTSRGIPVISHLGLTPQTINTIGSYKKTDIHEKFLQNIKDLQNAGSFCCIIECVNMEDDIAKNFEIPIIGIGCNQKLDGKIAVTEDLLGLSLKQPPFSKKFSDPFKDFETNINHFFA